MIEMDQYFEEIMDQGEPHAQIGDYVDSKPVEADAPSSIEASVPPESHFHSPASGNEPQLIESTDLVETETLSDEPIPKRSERPIETFAKPSRISHNYLCSSILHPPP